MKKLFSILILFLCIASNATAVTFQELEKEFVPQSTPEATYKLELKLMSQGIYCYGLPIFDRAWRSKGNAVTSGPQFRQTAQSFNQPFKSYIAGKYAIIYYPNNKKLGPSFLYKEPAGWILDRTTVIEKIHYGNDGWAADEGFYPYLPLLKKIFNLKAGRSSRNLTVYTPQ